MGILTMVLTGAAFLFVHFFQLAEAKATAIVSGGCSTLGEQVTCDYGGSNFSGFVSDDGVTSSGSSYNEGALGTEQDYFGRVLGGTGSVTFDGINFPSCESLTNDCSSWDIRFDIKFFLPDTFSPGATNVMTVTGPATLSGSVFSVGDDAFGPFTIFATGMGTVNLFVGDVLGNTIFTAGRATATFPAVPEPGTILLLGSGFLTLTVWRKRWSPSTKSRVNGAL